MADYVGSGRSNYFKVKDKKKFEEWLEKFSDVQISPNSKDDNFICLLMDNMSGDWPDTDNDDNDVNFFVEVGKHLAEGHVAVFISCGAEKLRYIHGYAIAVNHKGEVINITLDQIYAKAEKQWPKSFVTRAEY